MTDRPPHPAYAPPPNMAWVDGDPLGDANRLYLASLPDGEAVLLEGSARLIWLAAVGSADLLRELEDATGLPAKDLRDVVGEFLTDLMDRGLLVHQGASPTAAPPP